MKTAAAVASIPGSPEPRSLAERAYQALVAMITRLELSPGSLLVEKELMAQLGIGRTPLREALQRLAMEGLVVHQPNRGMYASEITATSVQHIYEFRSLIDGHAARLAAERATAEQAEALAGFAVALEEAINHDDSDTYVELDRRFYFQLAEAAQNIYLAEMIPRIFNLHLRLWFFISSRRGGWHDVARAHTEMIHQVSTAIRRRNGEAAEEAVKTYIARRHQDLRDLL